jgi:hypothetical protein
MPSKLLLAVVVARASPLPLSAKDASCEVTGADHGNSLLQARQVLGSVHAEEADASAPEAAGWLGWGRHVAAGDYWNMLHLKGESLFTREMPGTCFEDAHCRHSHNFKVHHFDSVDKWASFYSSSFKLGISGGYGGFSGSIDASLGSSTGSSVEETKRLSYAMQTSQRTCYRLVRDARCAYNVSNLQPALLSRLDALPKDSPYTAEKMEAWKVGFVQRFGTHVTTGSSHGALVHSLISADSRFEKSHTCLDSGACLKFGWTSANLELCSKTSSCDNKTRDRSSDTAYCVALGGDPALQRKICAKDVDKETLDAWMAGGDLRAGSSAFRFSFMPISEFLTNLDFDKYFETSRALQKAIEYSNCRIHENPPVQAWEDSSCRCVRQCANGGVLDSATCTCTCPGNLQHGWKGPECCESYGSCQAGPGTGNPGAARRCPTSNQCNSWYSQKLCKDTDVCCATNFGTTCCPFGSSCQCSHDKCTCLTGSA